MSDERKDRVFLSYASEDLSNVREVYEGLLKRGLNVWFDKEDLGPGKWKPQITRAITKSRYFVICLSNAAIRKTGDEPGFQDEELNEAYEIAKNQSETEFTILPVRLEDCHRGDHRLTLFQQYNLFDDFEMVLDKLAVNMGGVSLSKATAKDERTYDEKLLNSLFSKTATECFAGNYKESINLLDSILVFSPDNAEARYNKGVVFHLLGKHREALKAYDSALQIKPELAIGWYNKGLTLYILGLYKEAIQAYDKVLGINPDDVEAWNNKGAALLELGNLDKALNAYDSALEINPDYAGALFNKGIILEEKERYKDALAAFNKVLQLDPDDKRALKHRNCLMNQLKDSD